MDASNAALLDLTLDAAWPSALQSEAARGASQLQQLAGFAEELGRVGPMGPDFDAALPSGDAYVDPLPLRAGARFDADNEGVFPSLGLSFAPTAADATCDGAAPPECQRALAEAQLLLLRTLRPAAAASAIEQEADSPAEDVPPVGLPTAILLPGSLALPQAPTDIVQAAVKGEGEGSLAASPRLASSTSSDAQPQTQDTAARLARTVVPVTVKATGGAKRRRLRYSCPVCEKSFNTRTGLARHIRIHTGEKPFPCAFCDRRFRQKSTLVAHERVHTGEKPFECGFADRGCTEQFRHKSRLGPHHRVCPFRKSRR